MSDWSQFMEDVTWFVDPGEEAIPAEPRPWSGPPVYELPVLTSLLRQATVTPVRVGGRGYELLAWGPTGGRRGWLCLPPMNEPELPVHQIHRQFWTLCGGIIEWFGEPESWWNNQNSVLTPEAAETDLASCLEAYSWLWQNEGLEVPISPADYYVVAVEANGNLTLAHRETGQVLLFAPDHGFDGVTELQGCPPYSLMSIDEAGDLAAWIEVNARTWQ